MTPAQQLADLIASAAARNPGAPMTDRAAEAAQLVAQLAADPDERAVEVFFRCLANELRARGARLPSLDHLPPTVAPLVAALGAAFHDSGGDVDYEAVAARLEQQYEAATGTSPRAERERRMEQEIRERVASSVADALGRQGLTPAPK